MNEIIDEIERNLKWLRMNVKTDDIVSKVKVLENIALLAVNMSDEVSDVYALMNDLEDDYKTSVAKFVMDYDGTSAKGERVAEVEFAEKKKNWTQAKNGYKKLNTYLDRIDKQLDAGKQTISVIKQTNLKHMTG